MDTGLWQLVIALCGAGLSVVGAIFAVGARAASLDLRIGLLEKEVEKLRTMRHSLVDKVMENQLFYSTRLEELKRDLKR